MARYVSFQLISCFKKSVLTAGKFWYSRNVSYINKNYLLPVLFPDTTCVYCAFMESNNRGL